MGVPQVAFASRPFLGSFIQQTADLGVTDTPIIVIDAEVCHPAPVRRQVRAMLPVLEQQLLHPAPPGEERTFWAPSS